MGGLAALVARRDVALGWQGLHTSRPIGAHFASGKRPGPVDHDPRSDAHHPLAVYLRDIDANGCWSGLQNEIAASPPSLKPTLSSNRCSTILKLIPEWEQRSKDLLASFNMEATALTGFPDHRRKTTRYQSLSIEICRIFERGHVL